MRSLFSVWSLCSLLFFYITLEVFGLDKMSTKLPEKITFFYNRKEPGLEDIMKTVKESEIQYTALPTTGCSTMHLMYKNNDHISCYGPTKIKEIIKTLR